MVSATRAIIWRTERSRCGVPSVPRKYFWTTTLVAVCDQVFGNSTPRCSKKTLPSAPVMAAVRSTRENAQHASARHEQVTITMLRTRVGVKTKIQVLVVQDR